MLFSSTLKSHTHAAQTMKLCTIGRLHGRLDHGGLQRRSRRPIREQVGDKKVICALSGGVDSSVAHCMKPSARTDLCVRGPRPLRLNEAEEVVGCSATT